MKSMANFSSFVPVAFTQRKIMGLMEDPINAAGLTWEEIDGYLGWGWTSEWDAKRHIEGLVKSGRLQQIGNVYGLPKRVHTHATDDS